MFAEGSTGISLYHTGQAREVVRLRVTEIAEHLKAACEGDSSAEITGVAPLESAGPQEIAFVGSRKAAAAAAQSGAGCLLATEDFPPGRTVIRVADPRRAFAAVIRLLYPPAPVTPGIHPTASIAADAEIAASASVGPHVTIASGARIGEGCSIGAGCGIGANVRLGAQCVLHSNVTIYEGVSIGD